MAPRKRKEDTGEDEDWFAKLDQELEKKADAIISDEIQNKQQRRGINKALMEDFWKIGERFEKVRVHFTMDPPFSEFAIYTKFPEEYRLRDDFRFEDVRRIQLVDRTMDQGRMGDSIKVNYYMVDSTPYLRMTFEYCEGEQYYKYAGWKRIFAQFVIYNMPVDKVNLDKLHASLGDVVKAWYESHLRRDRDIVIRHLKESYERGETFTQ